MSGISRNEYWTEVESLAESITEEAREQDRDIFEVLHETIDGHEWVIFTGCSQEIIRHSANESYSADNFGAETCFQDGQIRWDVIAFGCLYGDVSEHSAFDEEIEEED